MYVNMGFVYVLIGLLGHIYLNSAKPFRSRNQKTQLIPPPKQMRVKTFFSHFLTFIQSLPSHIVA